MGVKRVLAIVIGGLFILGVVGAGSAQQVPQTGQPEKPAIEKPSPAKPAAKPKRLTGSVKSASEESLIQEVIQKDKSTKEYTFAVDPKAKISKTGKAITLKDLQPGDAATASFTPADGKLVAKAVTVRGKTVK